MRERDTLWWRDEIGFDWRKGIPRMTFQKCFSIKNCKWTNPVVPANCRLQFVADKCSEVTYNHKKVIARANELFTVDERKPTEI